MVKARLIGGPGDGRVFNLVTPAESLTFPGQSGGFHLYRKMASIAVNGAFPFRYEGTRDAIPDKAVPHGPAMEDK